MRRSTLNLVNGLKSQLLQFPAIVNSLEKKEITFVEKVFIWIKQCEDIFTTYNISAVAELAGLRSKILAVKFSEDKATSIRKAQLKSGSEVLYDLQNTVLKVVQPVELKVEECRELIRQLLLIVSETKAIQYDRNSPLDNLVSNIWAFITANEQLKAGLIKLKTNLPIGDIHLLLAEEINLEDF